MVAMENGTPLYHVGQTSVTDGLMLAPAPLPCQRSIPPHHLPTIRTAAFWFCFFVVSIGFFSYDCYQSGVI
jgi:hypothetical protein